MHGYARLYGVSECTFVDCTSYTDESGCTTNGCSWGTPMGTSIGQPDRCYFTPCDQLTATECENQASSGTCVLERYDADCMGTSSCADIARSIMARESVDAESACLTARAENPLDSPCVWTGD